VKTNSKLILPVLAVVQIINLQTLRALVPSCSVILPTTSSTSLSLSHSACFVLYSYLSMPGFYLKDARFWQAGQHQAAIKTTEKHTSSERKAGIQHLCAHTSSERKAGIQHLFQHLCAHTLSNKRMVGWVQRSMLQTRLVSQAHAHLATSNFRAGR